MELEKTYIFCGNLRLRRERALTLADTGERGLQAAGSYLRGMPFHAFTFYLIEETGRYSIRGMLEEFRARLEGDDGSQRQGVLTAVESCVERLEIPDVIERKTMLLMKLTDPEKLLPRGESFQIEEAKGKAAEDLAAAIGMLSFRAEEIKEMPHIALASEEGELIAMAGFHAYEDDFVEIGNIGTAAEYRKKGLGMQITSDICRIGLQKSPNVYLFVFADNEAAVRVYEKLGFATVERYGFVTFQW
ncbi:GNAT family N-acetyltransferase [Brevibacillus choshinensis]|uniref:GNAT family N-acetyltransferase n=2 Tax=Brevibacillus choshinensis TaxID=54911 RepID=A0ABX7FXA4_BRECH|nr:GNAT family N-acetyltransferase [Brevibacillus choshinensis]